jgi:hypothetical protein
MDDELSEFGESSALTSFSVVENSVSRSLMSALQRELHTAIEIIEEMQSGARLQNLFYLKGLQTHLEVHLQSDMHNVDHVQALLNGLQHIHAQCLADSAQPQLLGWESGEFRVEPSVALSISSFHQSGDLGLDPQWMLALKMLETEPVDDGMEHGAEDVVADLVSEFEWEEDRLLSTMRQLESDAAFPDLVRILGRLELSNRALKWQIPLIAGLLHSSDVAVRDAALQAVDNWGKSEFRSVLEGYEEPELWLRQYRDDLVSCMRG